MYVVLCVFSFFYGFMFIVDWFNKWMNEYFPAGSHQLVTSSGRQPITSANQRRVRMKTSLGYRWLENRLDIKTFTYDMTYRRLCVPHVTAHLFNSPVLISRGGCTMATRFICAVLESRRYQNGTATIRSQKSLADGTWIKDRTTFPPLIHRSYRYVPPTHCPLHGMFNKRRAARCWFSTPNLHHVSKKRARLFSALCRSNINRR